MTGIEFLRNVYKGENTDACEEHLRSFLKQRMYESNPEHFDTVKHYLEIAKMHEACNCKDCDEDDESDDEDIEEDDDEDIESEDDDIDEDDESDDDDDDDDEDDDDDDESDEDDDVKESEEDFKKKVIAALKRVPKFKSITDWTFDNDDKDDQNCEFVASFNVKGFEVDGGYSNDFEETDKYEAAVIKALKPLGKFEIGEPDNIKKNELRFQSFDFKA